MSDVPWLSLVEQARAVAERRLSPVEIVRAHLDRIERLDGRLKSFIAVFGESALAEARAAEAAVRAGRPLGLLHGVPVAVKDLYDVKGSPTTAGSSFRKEPAAADCPVVARLRSAGAILLGKLNLHEFAYGPEGINAHFGTPWNPWDNATPRLPGGSSSGSSVAVAAGLVPLGMGSDTGGSIRIPAACCGTVGLKPTYGRVSKAGVFPLSWSLDHAGPLTRRVADAAVVLAVIAGPDPADPTTQPVPVQDYIGAVSKPALKGLKVGVLTEYVEQADAEVQAALAEARAVLLDLGCSVGEIALSTARYSLAAIGAILGPEALAFHEPLLRRHASEYAVDVRRRLLANRFVAATEYLKGQRARRLMRDEVNQVLERFDCLLAPTLPFPAPPVTTTEVRVAGKIENIRMALTLFTRYFNLSGHPVVALPCGFSRDGLPLSMQLVGRGFDEATILRVAQAYEQATDWHKRRPAVQGERGT